MKEYKVLIQSLIDHIKTACDVDPWAKDMAEKLLKDREPVPYYMDSTDNLDEHCGKCKQRLPRDCFDGVRFCPHCGVPIAQNVWAAR